VLDSDDSIDTPEGLMFANITKKFYSKYPDKYDFLAIFPSFKPKNDIPLAGGYTNVQNNVRGICEALSKGDSNYWGSSRLKGIQQYPYSNSNYKEFIDNELTSARLLLEETGHQWLVYVGLKGPPPPGTPPDGLNLSCFKNDIPISLGDGSNHWSKGLQMPTQNFGAMRETRPWIDNGDGTYSYDPSLAWNTPRKFHPFDLYLIGLLDKSEMKDEYLLLTDVDNSLITPGPTPTPGNSKPGFITIPSRAIKVSINDIIDMTGEERNPNAKDSQKDFAIAFIILKKPGQTISNTMTQAINLAASRFPAQWAYATDYRSTVNK
jgi:hypothetical protein